MIRTTNRSKLASATMFTFFFGGNDFAPRLAIGNEPVQEFLQRHFVAAFTALAARVKSYANVIGFDSLKKPSSGFIGRDRLDTPGQEPRTGAMPTPAESIELGDGLPTRVLHYRFTPLGFMRWGGRLLNPEGLRAWHPAMPCVRRMHGVWGLTRSGRPSSTDPTILPA